MAFPSIVSFKPLCSKISVTWLPHNRQLSLHDVWTSFVCQPFVTFSRILGASCSSPSKFTFNNHFVIFFPQVMLKGSATFSQSSSRTLFDWASGVSLNRVLVGKDMCSLGDLTAFCCLKYMNTNIKLNSKDKHIQYIWKTITLIAVPWVAIAQNLCLSEEMSNANIHKAI